MEYLNVTYKEIKRVAALKSYTLYVIKDSGTYSDLVCGDSGVILRARVEKTDYTNYKLNVKAGAVVVVDYDEAVSKILFP